jgi:hypothetical protein
VLHHAVCHREVRRRVVQLDVTGEGRLARDDYRRGEDREDGDRRPQRPEARPTPRDRSQQKAGDGEPGCERCGELGRPSRQRRELTGENDDDEPDREYKRPRKALANG